MQDFSASLWDNQLNPSGVLEHPSKLGEQALTNLRRQVADQIGGVNNAKSGLILEEGMQFKPISMSAEDAELLASRRFTVEELARLFGVPPNLVGDLSNSSFTNSETMLRLFAQQTLSQWTKKLESELTRRLLPESAGLLEVEVDLTGLLRGDPETRWTSHEIAVRNGILTPNEVRKAEGWNPRDDMEAVATE